MYQNKAHIGNSIHKKVHESFTLNQTVPNGTVAKDVLDDFIEANGSFWPTLK